MHKASENAQYENWHPQVPLPVLTDLEFIALNVCGDAVYGPVLFAPVQRAVGSHKGILQDCTAHLLSHDIKPVVNALDTLSTR